MSEKKKINVPYNTKRLFVLQSYVFKPDIINFYKANQDEKKNSVKLPKITTKKKTIHIMNRNFKKELENYKIKAKNQNVQFSLAKLRNHLKNPNEFLYRKSFHKEKLVISKEGKNNEPFKELISNFINKNSFFHNEEIFKSREYEKSAPFDINQFNFVEQMEEDKSLMKRKYGWNDKNIKKNNLLLEHILLNRLEIKENSIVFNLGKEMEEKD